MEKVTADGSAGNRTMSSELPRRRRASRGEGPSLTPAQRELAHRMELESARRKALREAVTQPSEVAVGPTKVADQPSQKVASALGFDGSKVDLPTMAKSSAGAKPRVTQGPVAFAEPRLSRVEMRRRERLAQGGCASSVTTADSDRDDVLSIRQFEMYRVRSVDTRAESKPASSPKVTVPRIHLSRNRVLQGMTVSALAVAGIAVPVLGSFGGGQAQASQPLTASMLGGQSQKVETPSSLAGNSTAAIRSSALAASEQAKDNPATTQCSPEGAQGLRSAFIQEQQNLVVFPLPTGTYHRSSPFGPRVDPFTGGSTYHAGQDYAAPNDTPIHAVADGVVLHAGGSYDGRSPNTIVIRHEIDGKVYESWYVHMYDHGVLVKEGDTVKAGQQIGLVGSNGNSTGPHLHLEIHDPSLAEGGELAVLLNPDDFLAEHGAMDISEMCGQ